MKGFIHIFEVDEKTEKRFKEFAENVTCNRYNFAITYLLDFHETFRDVISVLVQQGKLNVIKQEEPQTLKAFGGNEIKLR